MIKQTNKANFQFKKHFGTMMVSAFMLGTCIASTTYASNDDFLEVETQTTSYTSQGILEDLERMDIKKQACRDLLEKREPLIERLGEVIEEQKSQGAINKTLPQVSAEMASLSKGLRETDLAQEIALKDLTDYRAWFNSTYNIGETSLESEPESVLEYSSDSESTEGLSIQIGGMTLRLREPVDPVDEIDWDMVEKHFFTSPWPKSDVLRVQLFWTTHFPIHKKGTYITGWDNNLGVFKGPQIDDSFPEHFNLLAILDGENLLYPRLSSDQSLFHRHKFFFVHKQMRMSGEESDSEEEDSHNTSENVSEPPIKVKGSNLLSFIANYQKETADNPLAFLILSDNSDPIEY